MAITAAEVKQLRNRTGAPMMRCRAALVEAKGNQEKAVELIRIGNAFGPRFHQPRETGEGRIGAFVDTKGQGGALVELRCESAAVARNDLFVQLAYHLARQVARAGAGTPDELLAQPDIDAPGRTVGERIDGVMGQVGEQILPVRLARLTGQLGSYIHHDGSLAVLVEVSGKPAEPALLRDLSMHVAALSPVAVRRGRVCKKVLDREHTVIREQELARGRSGALLERVVSGRFNAWLAQNVLVEQMFVKEPSGARTVGEMLQAAGLDVVRFVRLRVGGL